MTSPTDMESAFLRFVHEALGSLAAPAVRESVIGAALRMATNEEQPTSPVGFERFVRGPLRAAMLDAFGAEVTDSVSVELEHVVMLSSRPVGGAVTQPPAPTIPKPAQVPSKSAAVIPHAGFDADEAPDLTAARLGPPLSGSRRKKRPNLQLASTVEGDGIASQRPASQAYARGTARALGMSLGGEETPKPRVFVVSQSMTFVKGLEHFLEPAAARIEDVFGLLAAVNELGDARAVIVLDCKRPSIRPMALAILADELPPNVLVMLWGTDRTTRLQLEQLSPGVARWHSCNETDDLQAVARHCTAVVS